MEIEATDIETEVLTFPDPPTVRTQWVRAERLAVVEAGNARLRSECERLRSALAALVAALGDGEAGDDQTEWCVACKLPANGTPEYRAAIERTRARSEWRGRLEALGASAEEARAQVNAERPDLDWPAGVPHKDPCPLAAAREALTNCLSTP